jgi:hypothetical protein
MRETVVEIDDALVHDFAPVATLRGPTPALPLASVDDGNAVAA